MEATFVRPSAPPSRVAIPRKQEKSTCCSCLLFSGSHFRRPVLACSLKVSFTEHFGEPKRVIENLKAGLQSASPKPLKEFPWEKAKTKALERLLFLGKNALKWSFITWFIFTFVIDVSLAVSTNREVMIPVGLFIGVTLANFLKETAEEFFQSSMKDTSFVKNLLGIGSLFVLVKFLSSGLNMRGRPIFSHIGNGGLMQVLWLAKELQENDNIGNEETRTSDVIADATTRH